jgi:hypothetical protein
MAWKEIRATTVGLGNVVIGRAGPEKCLGCDDVMLRRMLVFSEDEGQQITFYPPRASHWLPHWQHSLPPQIEELTC